MAGMKTVGKWLVAFGFFAFILWVILLANRGEVGQWFGFIRTLPYGDKLGHAVLFGGLALLFNWALAWRSLDSGGWLQWGTGLVATFALFEELSQAWNPNRTLDWWDLMADGVGFLVATLLAVWLKRGSAPAPESALR